MRLSQFEEAVWHWRGSDGGPAEAWHHGGEIIAPIEAVLELGQVAGDVFLADRPVGGGDGGLDVAERGVDPLEGGCEHRLAAGSGVDRLMRAAGVGDTAEAAEAVADDGAGGIEAAPGQLFDLLAAEALDPAQLQAHRLALGRSLDGGDDRRLAGRAATALATGAFATEIGVLHLHPAGQAFARIPLHHHLHQLVLELPGGVLGHGEAAAELAAGDPALALRQLVHGAEPSAQRHFGRGEDRAGDHRGLASAGRALVERTGLNDAVMLPAAAAADEAVRPAPTEHRLPTPILAPVKLIEARLAEPLLKLNAVARHASTPPSRSRVPVLYHTRQAEES